MPDDTVYPSLVRPAGRPARRSLLRRFLRRRSTIAFLMCLPLIVIICGLVIYPALYSIHLSMLNKAETEYVGLDNFTNLLADSDFYHSLWITFLYAAGSGLVTISLAFVIAFVSFLF